MRSVARFLFAAFALSLAVGQLAGQQSEPADPAPIQDNSFLIEEAYNQEPGVIQHISFFTRSFDTKEWVYNFTEEWPVTGQKHQFSFTLSATRTGFAGAGAGIGDTAINYRYQLLGSGDTRVAISPRVSALLPSGDVRLGRGYGGAGVQVNLPVSIALNRKLVTHLNAGATWVPRARNELRETASVNGYNLGQSFIWLARQNFNVMLETVWTGSESVVASDKTQRAHDLLISPGVRWAHNFRSGLQIVPGLAVPIGAGPSAGDTGIILYLSFEHPLAIFGGRK
ncbi:MAG TPA: transporter [Clostridia bacterium]|nr:transporter [Clostridia bacterium]